MVGLFARWKYFDVYQSSGGPISQVEFCRKEISPGIFGYEAYAYLRPELVKAQRDNQLYGNSHGTGTGLILLEAKHKAISEALERWAYDHLIHGPSDLLKTLGFDQTASTTGMAAMPSFFSKKVREIALYEAIERFSVINWWKEKLPFEFTAKDHWEMVTIFCPSYHCVTVILSSFLPQINSYCYGFAAHKNHKLAKEKAMIELFRNRFILEKNREDSPSSSLPLYEKRLLYFSTEQGHELFLKKAQNSQVPSFKKIPWDLVIDCEIKGPWSSYAKVWRCLFAGTDESDQGDHFFIF